MENRNRAIHKDFALMQILFSFSSAMHATVAYIQQHYRGEDYSKVWDAYQQLSKEKDKFQEAVETLIVKANKEDR